MVARVDDSLGDAFAAKKDRLLQELEKGNGKIGLAKRTISNRFRYSRPGNRKRNAVPLDEFSHVLGVDVSAGILDVEGLATYESIVDSTLPHGLLPTVTPELKHITVGGATVGIGIESTCFRHGFVHDGLVEAEVLLPGGTIVTCTAENEHADLFRALPNSYGTLGYILRARVRLMPAKPYVHLTTTRFDDAASYLKAMEDATRRDDIDFIEGLFFSKERFFLMIGRFVANVPRVDDILRKDIFYKLVQRRADVYLRAKDYIFRYDPEWFWNIPDTAFYRLFRQYAPRRFRNSGFYTKYSHTKGAVSEILPWGGAERTEPLIQDWQVPWEHGENLVQFALENVDLGGLPWAAVPIRTPGSPALYPMRPDTLYFNLGSYTQIERPPGQPPYHATKIMDEKCFELGGIKMLYSSTFMSKEAFDRLYNGAGYAELKRKYDPDGKAFSLYEKAVVNQ